MPLALKKYNEYIGCVDFCDQITKYYFSAKKAHSWIKKIAFNFIEMSLYDSFVLYCKILKKLLCWNTKDKLQIFYLKFIGMIKKKKQQTYIKNIPIPVKQLGWI
ncbi:hypothetical protein CDIK_4533 [Cucumispora dikerogammari]|nr:hypothetical protein CDIK_4533 [Cucumispora dikerogammari]